MKNILLETLDQYLTIFPDEKERQMKLIKFLNKFDNNAIVDWNNFDGHVVASGFVYSRKEKKFLMLYHKDLKEFLYPGGHIEMSDINPLGAAKREIGEETGLTNLGLIKLCDNELVPVDIDTHKIPFNERLVLPEHYHYDFRYLFVINDINNIKIDSDESSQYQWFDISELKKNKNYTEVVLKMENLL